MKNSTFVKYLASALGAVLVTASLSSCAAPTGTSAVSTETAADCVVIDSDWDIDDLMAIPAIVANKRVPAVVITEGYSRAPEATAAAQVLLATSSEESRPQVIQGASLPETIDLEKYPWVADIRASLEKLNGLLATTLQPAASQQSYADNIQAAVTDCTSVDVVIIGPFTSFVNYSPLIADKINKVIMQGKPLRGDPSQKAGKISFNCEVDLVACTTAFTQLQDFDAIWVDVPREAEPPYRPSAEMVEGLYETALPGELKAALNANPGTWRTDAITNGDVVLLWDQSAALFAVHPDVFTQVGKHWETTLTPAEFQAQWTQDVNAGTSPTSSAKQAALGMRDVFVCFTNDSSQPVAITWAQFEGVSSHLGEGNLDKGQKFCAEGSLVSANVEFSGGFATVLDASNAILSPPILGFYTADHFVRKFQGGNIVSTGSLYTAGLYSEGETMLRDVEGHHFSVQRGANNDWINFTVSIID